MKSTVLIVLSVIVLESQALSQVAPSEKSLREADATQMRIIVDEDPRAQKEFMHPNYIINAPSNRVLKKEQVVAMLAKGMMASERFERFIEATSITGNIGIVMGREIVTSSANSQLGTQFGVKPLNRRFTNVFIWEEGNWRFLARQASIVVTP